MPLLDHFHPPLSLNWYWESFHATWAGTIADRLNVDLPDGYLAQEHVHPGAKFEIDVATFAGPPGDSPSAVGTVTRSLRTYAPPAPALVVPAAFPEGVEVRVYRTEGGATLVAAIELVSPGNKDRDRNQRAFAAKCAGYLAQGVSLVVVDVVTSRRANLHAAVLELLGQQPAGGATADGDLYAVAYRPVIRDGGEQIDIWPEELAVGRELPTLPLYLNAELCLPVDLEASYTAARGRRRLS